MVGVKSVQYVGWGSLQLCQLFRPVRLVKLDQADGAADPLQVAGDPLDAGDVAPGGTTAERAEQGKMHVVSMTADADCCKGEKRLACIWGIWYALGTMKLIILGSGTSTGVPMVGCTCPVCRSADPRDRRSRTSLLIHYAGKNLLVDCSTDLRSQMLREAVDRIDCLLLTHAHADHVNGIDDLRGFYFLHHQVIPCYACPATLERVASGFGYIFHHVDGASHPPLLEARPVDGPFELFGLQIVPIPLEHGTGFSCGYRIGTFAYLTDCSGIPPASRALLAGVKTVVVDGLRWTVHPYHFNIDGAIAAMRQLQIEHIILTHLTHEVRHDEEARLPEGVRFAFDGMTLEL